MHASYHLRGIRFKQRSDGVSNHHSHHSLHKRSFRYRSKGASKLHVTGLCAGNSPVTGKFPAQMASNAENVSIWWRHHEESLTKPLEPQVNIPPLWRNLYFAHGYLVDILYTGTRYIDGTSKCPDTNQRSDVLLDSVANRWYSSNASLLKVICESYHHKFITQLHVKFERLRFFIW